MIKIDREEFEAWRTSPMTEHFFKAVEAWAEDAKRAWVNASWDGGNNDPLLLAALKERATAYQQLVGVTGIHIEEKLNEQDSKS